MYYRSRDYDSLVELGARIGIKIRERDGSTGNNSKVRTLYTHYILYVHERYPYSAISLMRYSV